MLAKGSAGEVFNAHGNAILFWLPEVALVTPMHQCIDKWSPQFSVKFSTCHLGTYRLALASF